MVHLLALASILTGILTASSESPNLDFKRESWKNDFENKLKDVLKPATGNNPPTDIVGIQKKTDKLMTDPTIKDRFPDYTKPKKQTDVQEFIITADIADKGSRRKQEHTMPIPVPNKSMPDLHNLDEVKIIQSRVNVSLKQCGPRSLRTISFVYELRDQHNKQRPFKSKIMKKTLDEMTFAFNIFDEAAEDTRFVQKAIDSYRTPASKFNLTIKLRGVSSHCIEDMWAVVKYQIKKKTRNTRSGPALRVLDDNDEGCGLRKITIDFNHEDYRGTFKHIIRKPLQYEYYYCAGRCTSSRANQELFDNLYRSSSYSNKRSHMKPELCCVPDQMESMDLLYYHVDYDTHMMQKIPDMTALSCKCV